MRFVSYSTPEGPRAGLLRDGRVFDTGRPLQSLVDDGALGAVPPGDGPGLPLEDVTLLPPIGRPGKLICIGLNYRGHAEEQGIEPPETPTFFAKFANALAAPGATVQLPPWSSKVDYEAEVAFVIGDRC
jgi:2-keto-4-pentenoate hydratase/2-oxohepta-3-ene-1,7-dioic acid hydratase in catechol pathway